MDGDTFGSISFCRFEYGVVNQPALQATANALSFGDNFLTVATVRDLRFRKEEGGDCRFLSFAGK